MIDTQPKPVVSFNDAPNSLFSCAHIYNFISQAYCYP